MVACRPPPGLPHLFERRGLNPFALQAAAVAALGDQDKRVRAHRKISMFFVLSPDLSF